jgi:hypothetical protein
MSEELSNNGGSQGRLPEKKSQGGSNSENEGWGWARLVGVSDRRQGRASAYYTFPPPESKR